MPIVSADRQFDPGVSEFIPHLAPVEARMHHENFCAGKNQKQKADGRDPMRAPHPTGMRRCLGSFALRLDGGEMHGDRNLCTPEGLALSRWDNVLINSEQ